jgi:hypothetical protein
MTFLLRALDDRPGRFDAPRLCIGWSETKRQQLADMAERTAPIRSPLDPELAQCLLHYADGLFAEAEGRIAALGTAHAELIGRDTETFISYLFGAFVVQRFDLVEALLRDRYGYGTEFSIGIEENGPGRGRVRWDILPSGVHRFTFDAKALQHDDTRTDILTFQWEFPVYANYSKCAEPGSGHVIINQADVGQTPGLAFCENRPNFFLIPDCIFIPSKGYQYARETFERHPVPWSDKKNVAFWRGSTTGIPDVSGDWRSLERVKLCEIAKRHEHLGFIDAGLSSIIQIGDPTSVQEIMDSGLLRDFVSWEDWPAYKFLIDIDGNSSPWSNLFQRLLTGSTVLKVESMRGLNQWYYNELVPWENFVPIAPDMSDLTDKIDWLIRNDRFARKVGQAGRALAEKLTYHRELARSADTVANCFRYFNTPDGAGTPFGR